MTDTWSDLGPGVARGDHQCAVGNSNASPCRVAWIADVAVDWTRKGPQMKRELSLSPGPLRPLSAASPPRVCGPPFQYIHL